MAGPGGRLCRGHGARRTRGWMVAQGWNINEELLFDGSCQYLPLGVVEHHGQEGRGLPSTLLGPEGTARKGRGRSARAICSPG
jgi:hypothetical protein